MSKPTNPPYTDADDLILRTEWEKATPVLDIAKLMGRTPASIRGRANLLDLGAREYRAGWKNDAERTDCCGVLRGQEYPCPNPGCPHHVEAEPYSQSLVGGSWGIV